VLAISHQLPDLLDRVDRVAVVDAGRIVEVDTPDRLRTAPSSSVLRALLARQGDRTTATGREAAR
jgi:ABC-type multidrug transport system fused ATPase/permease subunit